MTRTHLSLPEVLGRGVELDLLEKEVLSFYPDQYGTLHRDSRCIPEDDESDEEELHLNAGEAWEKMCPLCWNSDWGRLPSAWRNFLDGVDLLQVNESRLATLTSRQVAWRSLELWAFLTHHLESISLSSAYLQAELEPWCNRLVQETRDSFDLLRMADAQSWGRDLPAAGDARFLCAVSYPDMRRKLSARSSDLFLDHYLTHQKNHLLFVTPSHYRDLGATVLQEGNFIPLPEENVLEILLSVWDPQGGLSTLGSAVEAAQILA